MTRACTDALHDVIVRAYGDVGYVWGARTYGWLSYASECVHSQTGGR